MNLKAQLEQKVGPSFVIDDPLICDSYAQDQSFVKGIKPDFIVKPKTAAEIRELLICANQLKIPITPYSSGLNLHGAALPSRGGIVIDMTRMKHFEINRDDWFVIVEPGVTYEELQNALNAQGFRLMVPFGVPPQRSVLTSYLERDTMLAGAHIEYGNALILDSEMVLPDGELFRTGCWNLGGRPGGFYGPGFNTLYRLWTGAQGTLGIFTKMIISVQYLSSKRKCFFISFESSKKIPAFIKMIQRKEIGWECFGLNRFNLAAILNDEWHVPEKFPVPQKESPKFTTLQESLPAWVVIVGISGSPYYPEERIAYEEEALKNICRDMDIIIDSHMLQNYDVNDIFTRECLRPWSVLKKFNFKGSVHDLSFKAPLKKLPDIEDIIYATTRKYNYPYRDVGGYFVVLERGRAIHCEFDLHSESNGSVDRERVNNAWYAASKILIENNVVLFDRPYGQWAELVYARMPQYAQKLKQIKNEIDPNGIMNPGKLCF